MINPKAFPRPFSESQTTEFYGQDGMTLRDYFAAKALQGIMSNFPTPTEKKAIAQMAYGLADAMLEQRESNEVSG